MLLRIYEKGGTVMKKRLVKPAIISSSVVLYGEINGFCY